MKLTLIHAINTMIKFIESEEHHPKYSLSYILQKQI